MNTFCFSCGEIVSCCKLVGLTSRDRLEDTRFEVVVDCGLYVLDDIGATGVVVERRPCGLLDLFGFTVWSTASGFHVVSCDQCPVDICAGGGRRVVEYRLLPIELKDQLPDAGFTLKALLVVDADVIIADVGVTGALPSEFEGGTGDFPWYLTSINGAGWEFKDIRSMCIDGKTNKLFSSSLEIGRKLFMNIFSIMGLK